MSVPTWTWTTNEAADSQVLYSSSAEWSATPSTYRHSTAINTSLVTSHSVTGPDLAPDTYHYSLVSYDAAGNRTATSDSTLVVTTSSAIYFGELLDWHNYPSGGLNGQTGFTTYTGSAIAQLNASRGKRASLYHLAGVSTSRWLANGVFQPFSTYQSVLDAIHANGMLPFWDWSPWSNVATDFINVRPAAIAAGNWDTQLNAFFAAAATWGKSVLIRPMWEMNLSGQFPWQFGNTGSWTIPSGNGWGGTWTNSISDFQNAWAKIRSLRDANGATNVKMACVANRHATSETATTFALFFPPTSQWDWSGVDSYPDYGQSLTNALTGAGAMSYLSNNYADLCALDPVKPIIVGEFAWNQSNNTNVTVNSVTSTASTITVTVAGAPGTDTWSAGGNAIALAGMTPSAYNREWDIASVSGTGPFTITISSTANPGTSTVNGTARFINRVQTASLITSDLESAGLPTTCPRVQAIVEYHVVDGWPDDHHPLDVDGNNTTGASFVAYKAAIGNGHYLAGQQMASDTRSFPWIPFQDQAVTSDLGTGRPTAQERYLDVRRSITGLKLLLPLTEVNGAASFADVSGLGRNGTPVGNPGAGAAGSVPALPNWTSPSFPGASGNYISVADNSDWSPSATNKPIWLEFGIYIASTWTPASFAVVSKYGAAGAREFIFGFYSGNPGRAFAVYDGTNLISGANDTTWPTTNVPHHFIALYDPSLAVNRFKIWTDGGTGQFGGGTPTAGTVPDTATPLMIGQNLDAALLWPAPAGVQIFGVAFGTGILTDASAAQMHATWVAAPVISVVSPGTPTGVDTTVTWSTDIGGSTWVEYGPTTAYGSVTVLNPSRDTSHSAHVSGLAAGTLYHYRVHSRNRAGTEAVSADSTFTTLGGSQVFFTTVL